MTYGATGYRSPCILALLSRLRSLFALFAFASSSRLRSLLALIAFTSLSRLRRRQLVVALGLDSCSLASLACALVFALALALGACVLVLHFHLYSRYSCSCVRTRTRPWRLCSCVSHSHLLSARSYTCSRACIRRCCCSTLVARSRLGWWRFRLSFALDLVCGVFACVSRTCVNRTALVALLPLCFVRCALVSSTRTRSEAAVVFRHNLSSPRIVVAQNKFKLKFHLPA